MLAKSNPSMVYHFMSEDDVKRIMKDPDVMVASDSGVLTPGQGAPHPRGYGNNARVLGRYVREARTLGLEEAVRKMTSLPARHFGFARRGELRAGFAADVVVFDPRAVADAATFEKPHQYAVGFGDVIVNGVRGDPGRRDDGREAGAGAPPRGRTAVAADRDAVAAQTTASRAARTRTTPGRPS